MIVFRYWTACIIRHVWYFYHYSKLPSLVLKARHLDGCAFSRLGVPEQALGGKSPRLWDCCYSRRLPSELSCSAVKQMILYNPESAKVTNDYLDNILHFAALYDHRDLIPVAIEKVM